MAGISGGLKLNNSELEARNFLKKRGFCIQQIDWIGEKAGKYIIFEIKERELFEPPPFWGTGLNKSQLFLRNKLLKDLGIRTYMIVFTKDIVYGQYLDILEKKGKYFDTKNDIRIYDIESFKKLYNRNA
jgi:hypothetical protein